MSPNSEIKEARNLVRRQFEEAQKLVLAVIDRRVTLQLAKDLPAYRVAGKEFVEYAGEELAAAIRIRASIMTPRRSKKLRYGDKIFYARLLKTNIFRPQMEMLDFVPNSAAAKIDPEQKHIQRQTTDREWKRYRGITKLVPGTREERHAEEYFLQRARLNSFIEAGVHVLQTTPRRLSKNRKIDIAYEAGLRRIEALFMPAGPPR